MGASKLVKRLVFVQKWFLHCNVLFNWSAKAMKKAQRGGCLARPCLPHLLLPSALPSAGLGLLGLLGLLVSGLGVGQEPLDALHALGVEGELPVLAHVGEPLLLGLGGEAVDWDVGAVAPVRQADTAVAQVAPAGLLVGVGDDGEGHALRRGARADDVAGARAAGGEDGLLLPVAG